MDKKSIPEIVNNIAIVVQTLNRVQISGEENMDRLRGSIRVLRGSMQDLSAIVNCGNEPPKKEDEECSKD